MAIPADDRARRVAEMIGWARAHIGTPYHHQGRSARSGLDCVGLLVLAARHAGFEVEDFAEYGPHGDPRKLVEFMDRNGQQIGLDEVEPGDILGLCRGGRSRLPVHLALRTERGIVHTDAELRRVTEHGFSGPWPSRAVMAWRL